MQITIERVTITTEGLRALSQHKQALCDAVEWLHRTAAAGDTQAACDVLVAITNGHLTLRGGEFLAQHADHPAAKFLLEYLS